MMRLLAAAGLCFCFLLLAAVAMAEDKKLSYVSLKDKVNHKLTDKFGNDDREGNFLVIEKGEKTLEGVKFKVGEGVIQLGSTVWTEMPEKVDGIKVEKKFAKLHILHATGYGGGPNTPGTAWHVEDDTEIGEYKINYEDKSVETIPSRGGALSPVCHPREGGGPGGSYLWPGFPPSRE